MNAVLFINRISKRLAPIGEQVPTAMLPVAGACCAERMLRLIIRGGAESVALVTHNYPERVLAHFGDMEFDGVPLQMDMIGEWNGSAGAIKGRLSRSPLIVAQGDVLCNADISRMIGLFTETDSDCTVAVMPGGGYSLDADGTVRSDIAGDCAIGDIYILSSRCASLIPDEGAADIPDLVKILLSRGRTVTGVKCDYYKQIVSVADYLDCQCDVLGGMMGSVGDTARPDGEYKLFEPCIIGENVTIGHGAVIGPNAVIESGAVIGESARVRRSVIMSGAAVGESARVDGAVVCDGAAVEPSAEMSEGSVLGEGAVLSQGSKLCENVRVWPHICTDKMATYDNDVHTSVKKIEYFGDDGIAGEGEQGMTPEFCCRVGAALGSVAAKVGVGSAEGPAANAFKAALASGVLGAGSQVWDFGNLIESQMAFVTAFCDLNIAAYISVGPRCSIRLIGSGGLPISRRTEMEIDRRVTESDFRTVPWNSYRETADVSGLKILYRQHLNSLAPNGLDGMSARVRCTNREAERLFEDTLHRLGCDVTEGMLMTLSEGGTRLSICDVPDEPLTNDRTVALCCLIELKKGHDLTVPADTPLSVDDMAAAYGRTVHRYSCCPGNISAQYGRSVPGQLFLRDGIMAAIYILYYLKQSGETLSELTAELPRFSTAMRMIESPAACEGLCERYGCADGGTVINAKKGRIMLTPMAGRHGLRMIAEACDAETAEEICGELAEQLLRELDKKG